MSESSRRWVPILGAAVLVAMSFWYTTGKGTNLYTLQARAWLDGRWDIATPADDLAIVDGRRFVPFPPFPSVLLLPFARLETLDSTASRILGFLLAALVGFTAWRLLRELEAPVPLRSWLVAGMLLGTGLWMSVLRGNEVWFFAHLCAFALLSLAVRESMTGARGLIAGGWVGLAFLSRQLTVWAMVFVVVALWDRNAARGRRAQWAQVLGAVTAFAVAAAIYLLFNQARFGSPFETGYAAIPLEGYLLERVNRYGLFHAAYLPFNFVYMFLQGPSFEFDQARLLHPAGLNGLGTSLTFASPFLFLACLARRSRLQLATWASVLLCLGHLLLYYNNGWVQIQAQRFSLDFIPVLLPLVALGARRCTPAIWKGLIGWSIGWNAIAFVLLPNASRWFTRL